jgi:hypothetical protein
VKSQIDYFVMAITAAKAKFWHYHFRQMGRLPHVEGEQMGRENGRGK